MRAPNPAWAGLLACLVLAGSAAAASELVVFGSTSPGGAITLEMRGEPGAPTVLVIGTAFLSPPAQVAGAAFYIDPSAPWVQLPLGPLPAGGELLLPGVLPNDPLLLGLPLHMQIAAPTLSAPTTILVHEPEDVIAPGAAGALFGLQLLVADLDGDGLGDVATGALGAGPLGGGQVLVSFGPSRTPSLTLSDPTPQADGLFGAAIEAADLLGTPDLDLVVGAPGAGPGLADLTGEVWIFEGPDFVNATQLLPPGGGAPGQGFGTAIALGDFDGDGATDIAVAEPSATVAGVPLAGRVHVFSGPAFTLTTTLDEDAPTPTALFGLAMAVADFDADGRDDLVVGAPAAELAGLPQVGEGFLYHGPLTGPPIGFLDPLPSGGAAFACRLEVRDLIGDATPDIVAGSPGGMGTPEGNPLGLLRPGEAHVFDGANLANVVSLEDPTPEPLGHFGFGVEFGDVNGDGNLDLLIGANLATLGGAPGAGEVFVYLGPDLAIRIEVTLPAPAAGDQLGTFVGAIDIDGDGRDELVATAPTADPGGNVNAGVLLVVDL